jgi:multidrug efflux system membrane fusion protein
MSVKTTILSCAGLLVLTSCSGNRPAPTAAQAKRETAVPVRVGKVSQQAEPLQLNAIGNVQAYAIVQVKSQVGGELVGVYFKEGQYVRKSDPLFLIDPQPYQAALEQAQANRARDAAQAATARTDTQRYLALYQKGIIPQQQYDQSRMNAQGLDAAVAADEAAIQTVRLQLGYTKIGSPIDGRTGSLQVNQGNLVKPNDVPLVVINQVEPIYVAFSLPGQYLPEIKRYMARRPLRVTATPKGGGQATAFGELTFVDNSIDVTTGTITLKGTFQNRDHALWPGEFVEAALTLTTESNAIVVPSAAIQTGQQGEYVFVVKADMTVESRPIVTSRTLGPLTVIEKGVQPDETVVTDGQLNLVPGAKVSVAGGGARP